MKRIIRLNEQDLHRVIKESLNRVLKETAFIEDGDLEPQYGKNPGSMWTYGTNLNPEVVQGLDPHSMRRSGMGDKTRDNLASWDYFDAVSNGADSELRRKLDQAYDERQRGIDSLMDIYGPTSKGAYLDSMNQPYGEEFDGYADETQKMLDKKWQDQLDTDKYVKQADSRPLHRKGSLNRVGMPESRMRNIVRESVNKVLAEMSLHKGSSVHRHSSGNWAPSGEGWKWKYDGDRVDRYLWRMKKDAEKAGCVGPHKFPMAKWFSDNAYSYFNYISEYGGDLEHVPCITNAEDDYEMSPEDLYRAIDELCYGNEIGYDNARTFG